MATLRLFYNETRHDNFTTATAEGVSDARRAGYLEVRAEGIVDNTQIAGTVPLKLFYSQARHDNFTTATTQGETAARNAGYRFVRVEGYLRPGNLDDDVVLHPDD